jgi:hypothetical protein
MGGLAVCSILFAGSIRERGKKEKMKRLRYKAGICAVAIRSGRDSVGPEVFAATGPSTRKEVARPIFPLT